MHLIMFQTVMGLSGYVQRPLFARQQKKKRWHRRRIFREWVNPSWLQQLRAESIGHRMRCLQFRRGWKERHHREELRQLGFERLDLQFHRKLKSRIVSATNWSYREFLMKKRKKTYLEGQVSWGH